VADELDLADPLVLEPELVLDAKAQRPPCRIGRRSPFIS